MVKLELSVINALVIESLLCLLVSHITLGDEFKALYACYLASLSIAGIPKVVGELTPLDLDMLGFDVKF